MKPFRIGVWQGECRDGDVRANLVRARSVFAEAGESGCRIVCLPECFLTGYGVRAVRRSAMTIDDPRLKALARVAKRCRLTALVGMAERSRGKLFNTQVILSGGRVAGHYSKTMLTEQDSGLLGFTADDDLPVFHAEGICFGVIICHDSSFPEVASTMVWQGARIIFSPHFNSIDASRMDEHRIMVRNNHVGLAAHYGVVVARSNVIVRNGHGDSLGYGDSAIFSPIGSPLAEAGLFTERLVTADVAQWLGPPRWRRRLELRPAVIDRWAAAARAALRQRAMD